MAPADACGLCTLDCGRHLVARLFEAREIHFCCMGCANVYAILLESGALAGGQNIRETEIFRRSLELGLISNPIGDRPPSEPVSPGAPVEEVLLQVGGMWCSACGWLIEHALRKLRGVVSAEVFFASDLAKVRYCPQYLPPDSIAARIAELGYRATEYAGDDAAARSDARDLTMRLGVAAFLWANIMALSVILYVGYFEQIAASASRVLPFILLTLATPMVFYCAWPLLRSAFLGIRAGQIRMEVLLSLGILTAYLLSVAETMRGHTHVYYDTAAAIITLVLAGKLIERSAKDRAARSVARLWRHMPKKVRLSDGCSERFVSIDALEPDTIFIVKTGERIPADGIILEGNTETDESLLTGESAPRPKGPGDTVVSGSLNAGSVIHVRALSTVQDSALCQIIRLVERALGTRAPIERTVDRVARIFVPAVIVLASACFVTLFFLHAGAGIALMRAVAVLVIACPCALGLATPLAITAALGRASQQGVLISDSRVLESMGKIDTVVIDKTGTVTQGNFQLLDFALLREAHNHQHVFLAEYLPLLMGIESLSEHMLGRAVVQYAREHGVDAAVVSNVEVRKGAGVTAIHNGQTVFAGNRQLAMELSHKPGADADDLALKWQEQGRTVAWFGRDRQLEGLLAFGDTLRPEAADAIQRLRRRGMHVRIVSGDSGPTTAAVASMIGVDDFIADAKPETKARIVQDLQRSGKRVAVIGDGVNDAPALAQADLGIAMGSGADIAMSAAPVVLVSSSLEKVNETFWLAALTTRIVRQNLFWAFLYNVIGLVLGVTGVLSPIFAAGAMLLSSTSVVANSMRLTRASGGER